MKNRIVTICSYNRDYVRKFLEKAHQDWIEFGYISKLSLTKNRMFCYVQFSKDDDIYYGWEWSPLTNDTRGKIFNEILVDVNISFDILEKCVFPCFRGNMDTDIKYFDSNKEIKE